MEDFREPHFSKEIWGFYFKEFANHINKLQYIKILKVLVPQISQSFDFHEGDFYEVSEMWI
jgi:hypothetical protein